MRRRCLDPNEPAFQKYGAAGITVCDRWESFDNFFQDMGERPEGTSLDRIDNYGNYEAGNCRWATPTVQNRNKNNNIENGTSAKQKCDDNDKSYGSFLWFYYEKKLPFDKAIEAAGPRYVR
jgi:hypothetical protein